MSKFKVGDKVSILRTHYIGCGLDVGTVHSVMEVFNYGVELISCGELNSGQLLYFHDSELELSNNTLTVGKTYTSKNGHEWLCIAVDGEYAHMRHPSSPDSAAYCFKTDGTNISQGGGDWDIKFGPDRRSITVQGSFVVDDIHDVPMTYHHTFGEHIFNMTIDMVDGKPDWSSAKLTGA